MDEHKYVLGIDLGTSNSVASLVVDGEVKEILINGMDYIPSVVSYLNDGRKFVGVEGKSRLVLDPESTVSSIKRHMGEVGFEVDINSKKITAEEISADILRELVSGAKNMYGIDKFDKEVEAVICIPANFSDNAKKATLDAAALAGIKVLYLLEEPIAAAIMYAENISNNENILVYDLGGGTFDTCILRANMNSKNKYDFKILAKEGIRYLGGDDFDLELMTIINQKCVEKYNISLLGNQSKRTMQKLKDIAEEIKIKLSFCDSYNLVFNYKNVDIDIEISREEFNEGIDDLIDETFISVGRALEFAKLQVDEIDKVILVGGSSLIPRISEKISNLFNKKVYYNLNPRTVVAQGAAKYARSIIEDKNGFEVNIEQIVTYNLGIMTSGRRFSKIISKGMKIPLNKSIRVEKEYYTQYDNQTEFNILVYQCEDDVKYINGKCICIGEFKLSNIRKNYKGMEKIYVTFEVNNENIVNIKATSVTSGTEVKGVLKVEKI